MKRYSSPLTDYKRNGALSVVVLLVFQKKG